jgi:hypothetical protein
MTRRRNQGPGRLDPLWSPPSGWAEASRLGVARETNDAMEAAGFRFEWTGGGCNGYVRVDGDIETLETSASDERECEAPHDLDEKVYVGRYHVGHEESGPIDDDVEVRTLRQYLATIGGARASTTAVAAALAKINRYRARIGERPLDPARAGWSDEDVILEARRIGNPRGQKRRTKNPWRPDAPAIWRGQVVTLVRYDQRGHWRVRDAVGEEHLVDEEELTLPEHAGRAANPRAGDRARWTFLLDPTGGRR